MGGSVNPVEQPAVVEVSSKIGDENLDRWSAILDLANHAANAAAPVPQMAYRVARCAELTYDYVVRDKHFAWEETVKAIAGICPSSCIAILSRWRDRQFGEAERLLPTAIHMLIGQGSLQPKAALALVGFRAYWDRVQLLRNALAACTSKPEKEVVSRFLYHYMRFDEHGTTVWRNIREATVSHDVTLPDIDQLIEFGESEGRPVQRRNAATVSSEPTSQGKRDGPDWDAVFSGIDLSSSTDVLRAYSRFRQCDPPYYHEIFFQEACKRIAIGREVEFIKALPEIQSFDLYHFARFLEQVPNAWATRLAVKKALAGAVKNFCRRYYTEIAKSQYYEILPFKRACVLSGIEEGEIVDVVLTAIGETTGLVGAGRLFTLVGLLSLKLSIPEALDALSFGLAQLERDLEESDGDGAWSETLAPPKENHAAVAGYIWACLGAPEACLRWEAAHVVRGLCTLGQADVLGHLVKFAKAAKGGPFADARLHFYDRHALQWLLIALARAADENPTAVVPHAEFLRDFCRPSQPHVLIRGFASQTLLTLASNKLINLETSEIDELRTINTPRIPIVTSKRYERHRHHVPAEKESGTKRLTFDHDMSSYWFGNLGDRFAKTSSEIQEEAAKVICDDWGIMDNGGWIEDERARRGLFRELATYHSHFSFPRVDDLDFYLSYHALMTVAGKLLHNSPAHQDPAESENEFAQWLADRGLSRSDGAWLADRRDSAPLDLRRWKVEEETDNWRQSGSPRDFERVLGLSASRVNLWGFWTSVSGSLEESIRIRSALVDTERAVALLSALQTTAAPNLYHIPDAEDDQQIDRGGFVLKGWVTTPDCRTGIDILDPWAGDIYYPPVEPAELARVLMSLGCDFEKRLWCRENNGTTENVLWSQVWGRLRRKDDEGEGERGQRLQASFAFVTEMLQRMNMDLIVEVQIRRELRRSRFEIKKDVDHGYLPPKARLFLIRSKGQVCAV